jgi:hypothetical protein
VREIRFLNNLHKVRTNKKSQIISKSFGATKTEGTDRIDNTNIMVMFKCQLVLSETTDTDPLELD